MTLLLICLSKNHCYGDYNAEKNTLVLCSSKFCQNLTVLPRERECINHIPHRANNSAKSHPAHRTNAIANRNSTPHCNCCSCTQACTSKAPPILQPLPPIRKETPAPVLPVNLLLAPHAADEDERIYCCSDSHASCSSTNDASTELTRGERLVPVSFPYSFGREWGQCDDGTDGETSKKGMDGENRMCVLLVLCAFRMRKEGRHCFERVDLCSASLNVGSTSGKGCSLPYFRDKNQWNMRICWMPMRPHSKNALLWFPDIKWINT